MIPAEVLRKKRDGHELTKDEIIFFTHGVVSRQISDAQAAAFLMACCTRGLSARETTELTLAMRDSGTHYNFRATGKACIDKHSTGGVGDKLSMLIVPLVAACGVCVPMMSGRGLGHTGGTVDKLESITGFRMDQDEKQLQHLLLTNNCFMIKPTSSVTPADAILYALRDVTGTIESVGLITASILSKKLVEDLDGLVIDMKVGRGAFMQTIDEARALAESMMSVARLTGLKMTILFTNMDSPLGTCVGNWMEMEECDNALRDVSLASPDIVELSTALAARMLMLADSAQTLHSATVQVQQVWSGGLAHQYFRRMIRAQGGDWESSQKKYQHVQSTTIAAQRSGIVSGFKTRDIGVACIELGAGRKVEQDMIDHAAGLYFYKKVGDVVSKGEELIRLQASTDAHFGLVRQLLSQVVEIGDQAPPPKSLILEEWSG